MRIINLLEENCIIIMFTRINIAVNLWSGGIFFDNLRTV